MPGKHETAQAGHASPYSRLVHLINCHRNSATARATDRLCRTPSFAQDAARCASTWVVSIAALFVTAPAFISASSSLIRKPRLNPLIAFEPWIHVILSIAFLNACYGVPRVDIGYIGVLTVEKLNDHPALMRLTAYGGLSTSELKTLISLVTSSRQIPKGGYVCHEGERGSGLHLLIDGWAASSISTGQAKRQLLKLHLIGDVVGMPGLPYDAAPDTVVALTPITVGRIDLKAFGALFRDSPRLAIVLFMISQEERAMMMERLFLVGGQDATARLSGFVLQLHARMMRQSPETGDTLRLPLTQADFADLLGITPIHLNRTLAELKRSGILTWSRKQIIVHDLDAMRSLAGLPNRTLRGACSWFPEAA